MLEEKCGVYWYGPTVYGGFRGGVAIDVWYLLFANGNLRFCEGI